MPKKALGVYLAADRKIGDIIFLARRKGFEPRQTGLAPRRSRAIGATALYPRPRSSSPNCASLRNLACGMRSAYIRFAQKMLHILRSGVRIHRNIQKRNSPTNVELFLLARRKGFEPLTFWSVARRSIQLS